MKTINAFKALVTSITADVKEVTKVVVNDSKAAVKAIKDNHKKTVDTPKQ